MKRRTASLLIGLIITAGASLPEGSAQSSIDLRQYRNARYHRQRVLVKYRGEQSVQRVWLKRGEEVLSKLRELARNPWVEYAEPDLILTIQTIPNDERMDELWGMETIRAAEAWDLTTGSDDVVIAIADTGVDYTHPDLTANIWRNLGEIPDNGLDDDGNGFRDDYYGWNAEADSGDPMDDNDHGTHVAGTIGAVGDNLIGVAGINWRVSLMALKFLDASGSGSLSDAIEAIDYAVMMKQRGVNIVAMNASWGSPIFSRALQQAVDRATEAGILFVAAAGNDGTSSLGYPAGYANALAVAALDGDGEHLASFSNFGLWVDVAAPGVSILSTVPGGGYARFSGTSMATPHVAGLAGLIASIANLSGSELRQAIDAGVRVLPTLAGRVASNGRIDAAETLDRLGTDPPSTDPPEGDPPSDPANQPPRVSLMASALNVTAGAPVMITALATDPDQDPLTYQWETSHGRLQGSGPVVMLETADIASPSGAPVEVNLGVSVDDGRGAGAEATILITVTPSSGVKAKFRLQVDPSTTSLRRGRAILRIRTTPDADYQNGEMRLKPVVLNNPEDLFVAIAWDRKRRKTTPPTARMYITLRTLRPSASEYRILVRGLDAFGGETTSNMVIATIP